MAWLLHRRLLFVYSVLLEPLSVAVVNRSRRSARFREGLGEGIGEVFRTGIHDDVVH